MDREVDASWHGHMQSFVTFLFRGIVAINFTRFALLFSPRFEGSESHAGEADRLFGAYRIGGFRADFAWLVATTLLIVLSLFYFRSNIRKERSTRFDTFLGGAWVAAFVIYIVRMLTTGLLDFG